MSGFLRVPTGILVIVFSLWNSSCEQEAEGRSSEIRVEVQEETAEDFRDEMDRHCREQDARWAKFEADREAFQTEWEKRSKNPPPKRRRVKRFQWESPAETRGKIWNVPDEESEDALLTAFVRVCIAEANGNPQDCVGIWQVVKNNRRRTCDRGMIRRITECDDNGETMLSALRRHQRHVLGYMKARNKRAVWIGNITTECEMPEGWTKSQDEWDAYYGSQVCPQVVADARHIIADKLPPPRPGHRVSWLPGNPVTWGGRCENNQGSCDDRIACSRGLARVQGPKTLNAFWCYPGRPGCRSDVEPICKALGYGPREEELTSISVKNPDSSS